MIPRAAVPEGPPRPPREIDPDAPAAPGTGLFDLGLPLAECRVVAVPVPYEATASGRPGTIDGPRALLEASRGIDLHDPLAGEAFRLGIGSLPEERKIRRASSRARAAVAAARAGDREAAARADGVGREVQAYVEDACRRLLATGRVPIVVGGEHAVSAGAFRAAAAMHPGVGILQIDAHPDLRPSYEGLRTSHASVMHRALEIDGVARIVAVGLRDIAPADRRAAEAAGARCVWFTDSAIGAALADGNPFAGIVRDILAPLPRRVWLSLDADGLEPSLCPGTGTPSPGGLTWRELAHLLGAAGAEREIVGADIVEIGPGRLDGLVAARAFYVIAGMAAGQGKGAGR